METTAHFDEIARQYAENHLELGAMEDAEETEEGLTYFFENGAITVNQEFEITVH